MIQKIRAGNRITHVWTIVYKEAPVDLTKIRTGAKLTRSIFNKSEVIPFEVVDTNKIRSQHLLYTTGVYNLKFECAIYDESVQGNYRECTVDANVFEIVDMSEKADVSSEYISTSDIAVGLQGKSAYEVWLDAGNTGTVEDFLADIKGDPFTYEDFTPEQLEALKVKGDPFTFDDFTPEQIQVLQAPAREAAEELPQLIEEEVTRVIAETPAKTNPGVIDLQPGEYLMDKIIAINALPEAEKPTAEKPITINFYNHSKTIDWSRWNGLIQVPRFVAINFVGNIEWWSVNYYPRMGFDEGLISDNPLDKLFLGFSFDRTNTDSRIFTSGLPLDLSKIYFGGLDEAYQEVSDYSELDADIHGIGLLGLVRVNGSKIDDIRNDALYKKVNGVFVDITPNFSYCDLSGCNNSLAYFDSANNQGAYFNFANNQGAYFNFANNLGAYFNSANNQGAYFNFANNQGADFRFANLKQVNWDNVVSIVNANFQNADLTGGYNLPERINTKAKWIAECGVGNVNAQTIWIDGTSILS